MFSSEDLQEFYSVISRQLKELEFTRGLLQKTRGSNPSLSQERSLFSLPSLACSKCQRIWSMESQGSPGKGMLIHSSVLAYWPGKKHFLPPDLSMGEAHDQTGALGCHYQETCPTVSVISEWLCQSVMPLPEWIPPFSSSWREQFLCQETALCLLQQDADEGAGAKTNVQANKIM